MTLYPAIDLKDGKAVRLTKGLMDSAKIYSDEPWNLVKKFEKMGAKWVHIIDLNGAFAGEPKNLEQIIKIRKNCNVELQRWCAVLSRKSGHEKRPACVAESIRCNEH